MLYMHKNRCKKSLKYTETEKRKEILDYDRNLRDNRKSSSLII